MPASFLFQAAFGGKVELAEWYAQKYEPYLTENNKYAAAQMTVYLFLFLPYYAASIYALIFPGETWMSDWSLIHAGAAAQVCSSFFRLNFIVKTAAIYLKDIHSFFSFID